MKTWLEINHRDGRTEKRSVREDGSAGRVSGACPGCKATPFLVNCHTPERIDEHTIRAGSRSVCCDEPTGYVFHRPDTIFGLAEDDAVLLYGRARVYG